LKKYLHLILIIFFFNSLIVALNADDIINLEEREKELQREAELGDTNAQFMLGRLALEGKTPPDHSLAVYWFRIAAESNHIQAQEMLGAHFFSGLGVPANPEQAYNWTDGYAIFASGSPFGPVQYNDKIFHPGQGNNAYIFPGVGLGVVVSRASLVTDEMFIAAAETLANLVSDNDLEKGRLFPPLTDIREISRDIAVKVAEVAFDKNIARVSRPENLMKTIEEMMFSSKYPLYV